MSAKKNKNVEEQFNDYEATPVPEEVHMSWLSQGAVWIGCGFCLAAISTGGILANGLGFKDMVIAAILGAVILTIIAATVGIVGAKTHLSSSMGSRFCFGTNGARIFGLILALSNFGWFAFQADLFGKGDCLKGDVIVSTHVCPDAPTKPHEPVAFMGSPVEMYQVNQDEVTDEMDAILSIDTTKGNRIANERGFFISPTVKEGYILRVSERLLDLMEITTGRRPKVFALTQQDITPYGNDLFHINSILQPSVATSAPVVGVAITTETVVPGCATGATHMTDVEEAARFVLEVAKEFGQGVCAFYDKEEYARIQKLYGSMTRFQGFGE